MYFYEHIKQFTSEDSHLNPVPTTAITIGMFSVMFANLNSIWQFLDFAYCHIKAKKQKKKKMLIFTKNINCKEKTMIELNISVTKRQLKKYPKLFLIVFFFVFSRKFFSPIILHYFAIKFPLFEILTSTVVYKRENI